MNWVKGRILLNWVVLEGVHIFKLFTGEDQTLLVGKIPSWCWILAMTS
jgi:hypothetical protein